MSRLRAGLAALSSRSGLRRVLLAYCAFDLVEFFVWMLIILWAFSRGGVQLAGVAAVAQLVPAALLAPAIASAGDRYPRGTALLTAYAVVALTCFATFAALVTSRPDALVIAASATATTAIAVIRPLHFSALPLLAADPEALVSANVLSSVADGTFRLLGPVAAGLVVVTLGYWQGFALAAGVALVAAALCLRLGLPVADAQDEERGSLRVAAQGVLALRRDGAAIALLLVMTVDFVVTGAVDVLGVSYSRDVLGRDQVGAGLVIGSLGVGWLLGMLLGRSVGRRRRLGATVVAGGVIEGLCLASVALIGMLAPAMLMLVLTGMAGTAMIVSGRTLLQRSTDDRVLARIFSVQQSTTLLGTAVGAALAPWLVGSFSARWAFIPLGVGCAALALSGLVLTTRLDDQALFRPAELELLRGVPYLAVLPPYDLERLAQSAYWRTVRAGEVVVRKGDPGEAYYVVAEGTLTVTGGDVAQAATLRPGTAFGDTALLRPAAREATVTADVEGLLLVVDAGDFRLVLSGRADGHAMAIDVTDAHLARNRPKHPLE